jgi:hypothetical protein
VLDVEPTWRTRQWFDRFNQFDYRTLGRHVADADYTDDLVTVELPKGICHLIICAKGLGESIDLTDATLKLRHLCGHGGSVLMRVPSHHTSHIETSKLQRQLEEAGFSVRVDDIAERLSIAEARQFGVIGAPPILLSTAPESTTARTQHRH